MCITPDIESARAERMRQHAREFKNERTAREGMHPGAPVAPGWAMKRDSEGNLAVVPETRATRQPLGMSLALRRTVAAIFVGAAAVVLAGLYQLAPLIVNLLSAITPRF